MQIAASHPGAAPARSPKPRVSKGDDIDQFITLSSTPWPTYVALHALMDRPGLRMAYDQGVLQIMSPSKQHEIAKKLIARLIEAYSDHFRIPIQGLGSMTMRNEPKERGLEPDECYVIGESTDRTPDFAIEVVMSHNSMDKLPIYASLGVREVWFWCDGQFALFELDGNDYRAIDASRLLPNLDLARMAQLVGWPNQFEAVQAFRAGLA